MIKIFTASFLAFLSFSVQSATLDILSLNITGGSFGLGNPAPENCTQVTGFEPYDCITSGTITMGAYQQGTADVNSVVTGEVTSFNFFDSPVKIFTAASAPGAEANPTGAPSGTTDGGTGTITVDLNSWYMNWNGDYFRQGDIATGTYDAVTGGFDISWSALIVGGPFNGRLGYWNLTGAADVSAVPVPAAIWLFGSGLIGLAGLARRSK